MNDMGMNLNNNNNFQMNCFNNNMNMDQPQVFCGNFNIVPQISIPYRNNNERPKEIIPRGDASFKVDNPYPNEKNTRKVNILLVCPSGYKVNVWMPLNKKVCDLFEIFVQKIGIGEKLLGTQIYFFYEAGHLDVNDQRLISEVFRKEHCVITVIDPNNVIGA